MSKNRLTLVCSILLLSALLLPTFAVTQEEPAAKQQTYIIPWSVLDAGGKVEEATSVDYRLKDAIGQPVIGKCENANYRLYVGFLAAPEYVEKAFPVEEITIGDGTLCYSFAIFADPQSDFTNLDAAVSEINSRVSSGEDIRFVIVLGDIIQGEKGTAGEYQTDFDAAKAKLDKLGDGNPNNGVEIPYIPIIGNHDVWCNIAGAPIHRPNCDLHWGGATCTCTPIPQYSGTPYPEQIFETVFGPVYTPLSTTLAGWTKQGGMPISPNPHSSFYLSRYLFPKLWI